MKRKPEEPPIFSARRQRYTVSPVHEGLVAALDKQFQKRKPKPLPMELALLAQQLMATHSEINLKKPQEIRRLAEIGYRTIVPYTYKELQANILPAYDRMADLEAAAKRVADAVASGEQIGISGDYDCDGNCSTALMIRFLQESGVPAGNIHVHIPNRVKEGYGVNTKAVEKMAQAVPPVTLMLTLDNGTMAEKPIAVAKDKRMDVVVIDHHPNSEGHALPAHAQIVNPRRSDESASITNDPNGAPDLAAVGVTWLVARRAAEKLEERGHYKNKGLTTPDPRRWLGLVAMATIGDVVSLKKPLNHALVCEGLTVIHESNDLYIAALARVAGMREPDIAKLSESDIAFKLAPIINAPGRLGQSVAWAFLSPTDSTAEPMEPLVEAAINGRNSLKTSLDKVSKDSKHLKPRDYQEKPPEFVSQKQYNLMILSDEANELRKKVAAEVNRQARKQAQTMLRENPTRGTLLLAGEDWHEGVVGIVAGRIKEEFGLPTIVASINRERGLCKASARNILGGCGDVGQVLRDMCEKDRLLSKAGGHPMAAGTSFDAAKLDAVRVKFEERLGGKAREILAMKQTPLAAAIDLSEAIGKGKSAQTSLHMLQQFVHGQEITRPHGQGREKPRVALYGGVIPSVSTTRSSGQHLQFGIQIPGAPTALECRAFHSGGSKLEDILRGASMSEPSNGLTLLIGTLEHSSAGTHAGALPTFYVEDTLTVPAHGKDKKKALAAALSCDESQLNGSLMSALSHPNRR